MQQPRFRPNLGNYNFPHHLFVRAVQEKSLRDDDRFVFVQNEVEIARSLDDLSDVIPGDVTEVLSAHDVQAISRFTKYVMYVSLGVGEVSDVLPV